MRVLVTGSNGFVGSALIKRLLEYSDYKLVAASRYAAHGLPEGVEVVRLGDLSLGSDWSSILERVDIIVHTAARVHVMDDKSSDPLAEFRRVNVYGTLSLAEQAARAGVKRFIFISSIKVNGERTSLDRPYTANDNPAPVDAYGISKHEAEIGLRRLSEETGMETVIIRPPLVYGPGVKANFLAMMRWLYKRIPLPLGAIHNKRSLVALDNLVDLIATSVDHPAAANRVFLVSDNEDLSTTELLERMGRAMGRPARLLPVPASALEWGALMLGRQAVVQRLCDSLRVDISRTHELLDWSPPVSVDEALRKTAEDFMIRIQR